MGIKKREKWVKGTLTSSISFYNTVNFFIFYFTLIIFSLSFLGLWSNCGLSLLRYRHHLCSHSFLFHVIKIRTVGLLLERGG